MVGHIAPADRVTQNGPWEKCGLTVFQPDGVKTAIVELTNPRLDGKNLSYNVKVLQGISSTQPAEGVLFIDNYTGWAANAFHGSD